MNNQERAKQFMPFDALKGLKEALKDREERRTRVPKIELSDDMADELSRVMARVELCSVIRIKHQLPEFTQTHVRVGDAI